MGAKAIKEGENRKELEVLHVQKYELMWEMLLFPMQH